MPRRDLPANAAKKRQESLDHVLIFGPPGLGKTTLAHVIANELGVNLKHTSGPAIEKPGDLAAILTNLEERDVLFVDEIHRLSSVVEEILYPALEDYQLDLVIGEGPSARSIRLDLTSFTMIGATTRAGLLTSPLRDRFGISQRLEFYNTDELTQIVKRSAGILEVPIDQNGAQQDVAFMVCSKKNTSNHYGGSGSSPKCNNSSNADSRYVLQMDRSLNVNLFKYNSSTSRWIKTR